MAVYDDYLGGAASILGITANKRLGQSGASGIQVAVTFQNNGEIAWQYGVGFTIRDSAGALWNCWDNNIVAAPAGSEGSINRFPASGTLAVGSSGTANIVNIPIPSNMALGAIQFKAAVWKTNSAPLPSGETALARWPSDGSWASLDSNGNSITITYFDIRANITSLSVS